MAKSQGAQNIIDTVEDWFKKLPNLPKNITDVIVKITPWIALIFGVLGVLGGIAALGIFTAFTPALVLGGPAYNAGIGFVTVVLGLVASVLLLMAFPGVNKRKLSGWNLLFWSEAVSLVSAVIAFSLGGIVFSLIAFYIIFQIKSYYR